MQLGHLFLSCLHPLKHQNKHIKQERAVDTVGEGTRQKKNIEDFDPF